MYHSDYYTLQNQQGDQVNDRRKLIIALGAGLLAAARGVHAQQARKVPQIGYVGNSTRAMESALVEAWPQNLRPSRRNSGRCLWRQKTGPSSHFIRAPT